MLTNSKHTVNIVLIHAYRPKPLDTISSGGQLGVLLVSGRGAKYRHS